MHVNDSTYKLRKHFYIRRLYNVDHIHVSCSCLAEVAGDIKAGKPLYNVYRPGDLPSVVRACDLHQFKARRSRRTEKVKRALKKSAQTKVRATFRTMLRHEDFELLHPIKPPCAIGESGRIW